MSWVPCPDCEGVPALKDHCPTCHGNGGAFAMPPDLSSDKCWACGKTLGEHLEEPGKLVPRMPCLGLKKHFRRG